MYIVIWFYQINILVYTCTYISLITMTNKSVTTFTFVNEISVCLSVCEFECKDEDLQIFDFDLNKYEYFSPTLSFGSRQRHTASSERIFNKIDWYKYE